MACSSLPRTNLPFLMSVSAKKESDCMIMEMPLKPMTKPISASESGVWTEESAFAPFVISTMPDIIPSKYVEVIEDCALRPDSPMSPKRSITREKNAM